MTELLREQTTPNWLIRAGVLAAGAVLVTGCEVGNSSTPQPVTTTFESPATSSAPVASSSVSSPESSVHYSSSSAPEPIPLQSAVASRPIPSSLPKLAPNTMEFSFMCDEVVKEVPLTATELTNGSIGENSPIDTLEKQKSPQPDCEAAIEHAQAERAGPDPLYETRAQRVNRNYLGFANRWVPEVGHWPGTPEPGQPGNAVLFGHRTDNSAPFATIDMAKDGDLAYAADSDGTVHAYSVVDTFSVNDPSSQEGIDSVLNYKDPEYPNASIVTIFACGPTQRLSSTRIGVRLEELQAPLRQLRPQ